MSKLSVKAQESLFQSSESLEKLIEEGQKINYSRCRQEPVIEDCRCMREKGENSEKFYVCKILYPPERGKTKYPECDHANDVVPNRDVLTHEMYMQLLATPKKHPRHIQMPRWIHKNIPPATVHVHNLAQPRNRILMETFRQNCNHFSIFQIETVTNNIFCKQFSTPQQALNEMKQRLCDQKRHVRYQKNEIKKLQRKIEKCNEFNILASTLTKMFREYMIKERHVDACPETEKLASFTHDHLSRMFKDPKCDKNSSDLVEKVLIEFSNKFASFMCGVLENKDNQLSSASSSDRCLERLKKLCLPVEDYYPHAIEKNMEEESETSSETTAYSDEETSDDDFISAGDNDIDDSGGDEQTLLLTPSKINISRKECVQLNEKLTKIKNDIDSGTVKATASKKGDKTVTVDENGGVDGIKIRRKKKPKKKKGKKKNEKCFGNRDVKPQWAIEWRDRVEGGICSNTIDKK